MHREELFREIEAEARRLNLRVDEEVYRRFGREPRVPIVFAGNPRARVCIFGRDLGAGEVREGQPLVGAAGRIVRATVLEAMNERSDPRPDPDDAFLDRALKYVFIANAVPYKPVGNRPFGALVYERMRPFIERVLVCYWQGDTVLALGAWAVKWFRLRNGEHETVLEAPCDGRVVWRQLTVLTLPHPSPANACWKAAFPALLREKLRQLLAD